MQQPEISIHPLIGRLQYMNGKCRKIHKKRILSRIVAEAYYTYQGVSQRSKKLQCGTPFLMGKSEHGGVLFQLAV